MHTELTDVPQMLVSQTGRPAPARAYSRLWAAVVDGRLRATKVGGRWRIRDEDLAVAARILGMAGEPASATAT